MKMHSARRKREATDVQDPQHSYLTRRQALQVAGVATASLWLPRKTAAMAFGTFPQGERSPLSEQQLVRNVLEVYMYGGLSPWESFYFVPDRGRRERLFYYAFDDGENDTALSTCGFAGPQTMAFAKDAAGVDVHTGPFAQALFDRPDLLDRMRVLVQKHELLPHEAAVPYGITGKFLGSSSLSSLASHIQRASLEQRVRATPYSYVLMNASATPDDNVDAFVATGRHPGNARPLRLNLEDVKRLQVLFGRPSVGIDERTAYDAYINLRVRQFGDRLRHMGMGESLRSSAFQELAASTNAVATSAEVAELLDPRLLEALPADTCGQTDLNYTQAGLRFAAHLLKHPEYKARYVCVMDSGITMASGGGGYDTHGEEEQIVQLSNLDNLLRSLAGVVNQDGERDPQKLDLDETLIILNTEFGRTPGLQDVDAGRNHHTNGYVTAMLGGPVVGRSIRGAIDEAGIGRDVVTPAENRIGALLALGLNPFSSDSFSLSEVQGATSDAEAARLVVHRVLGVDL